MKKELLISLTILIMASFAHAGTTQDNAKADLSKETTSDSQAQFEIEWEGEVYASGPDGCRHSEPQGIFGNVRLAQQILRPYKLASVDNVLPTFKSVSDEYEKSGIKIYKVEETGERYEYDILAQTCNPAVDCCR